MRNMLDSQKCTLRHLDPFGSMSDANPLHGDTLSQDIFECQIILTLWPVHSPHFS